MENGFLARKKLNAARLPAYGFVKENENYVYSAAILDGQFCLTVFVESNGKLRTKMIDTSTGEEYVLYRTSGASGAFVGRVREQYTALLMDIVQQCYEPDVFRSGQAKAVIAYVRDRYGDELEYLWQKFPDNAVWRRKNSGKWYGALLVIPACRLGLECDERIEIIDLRAEPDRLNGLVDNEKYFPGYHMSKKHWFTVCLNGSVGMEELTRRIDESYCLAKK